MGVLQDTLDLTLRETPARLLTAVVEKKLREGGVVDATLTDRIVNAILDRDDDSDEIDIDLPCDLEFTEADGAELEQCGTRIIDSIPDLIDKMGKDFGRDLTDEMHTQWRTKAPIVAGEREELRQKIAACWGRPSLISALYSNYVLAQETPSIVPDLNHAAR